MSVIPIYTSKQIREQPNLYRRLFDRSFIDYQKITKEIMPSIQEVKEYGDTAILNKYRKRGIPINDLRVSQTEIDRAFSQVSQKYVTALQIAKANLEQVCLEQVKSVKSQPKTVLQNKQVKIWRRWIPIERVGVYAPGGNANYPSSVMMAVVPACVAGVSDLVLTVPPKPDGTLPVEVLVTASTLGVTNIVKIGGPQAIAALAYGTQSIPKVDLIVGPGNQYVTAAKIALFPQVQIDMPAGPSENIIIADQSANPKYIAADLLTDCEHGVDSTGILITSSSVLAKKVQAEVTKQLQLLSSRKTIEQSLSRYGAILVVTDLEEATRLANEYAPEHLQIFTRNPIQVASTILNAGSVFIGQYSAKAIGDYCSGANHILPTGGTARMFGALSVESFGKYQEFQQVTKKGFERLARTARVFAEVEKLPAHAQSITARLGDLKK